MKKRFGFGKFYCTACGARLLQGSDLCPACGQNARRASRAASSPRPAVTERDVLQSRAFRTYQRKNTLWKLVWAVALAVGVPYFLWSSGEIDLRDGEGRAVAIVVGGMFLLIGIGSAWAARRGREWRQKAARDGRAGCVACGFPVRENDAFCGKCGCPVVCAPADDAQPCVIIDAPASARVTVSDSMPEPPAQRDSRRAPRTNLLIGILFIAAAAYVCLCVR